MKEELVTAGYCGLPCKACSVYIASSLGGDALEKRAEKAGVTAEQMYCKGCRSDKTSPYCTDCKIKSCIRERQHTWCSECSEFPCEMLIEFRDSMPHRAEIIKSLEYARKNGFKEWDKQVEKDFTCKNCGTYNSIYSKSCRTCGTAPVNAFAQRNSKYI